MACKYCHKPKVTFVQGKIYSNGGELYIYAQVGFNQDMSEPIKKLISLQDGNRYSDDASELKETSWKEVPYAIYRQES